MSRYKTTVEERICEAKHHLSNTAHAKDPITKLYYIYRCLDELKLANKVLEGRKK